MSFTCVESGALFMAINMLERQKDRPAMQEAAQELRKSAVRVDLVGYQCREISEGDWVSCDKSQYEHCQGSPLMDTRVIYA